MESGSRAMALKVQVQDISPVKKRMEVEVPAEEVDREVDELVRKYQRVAKIPGFRKGHVPVAMVQKRFAREIEQEASERVVSRSYALAVKEQELRPLHDPVVEEVVFRRGEPLRFRTLFEVRPKIALGSYRGLARVNQPAEVTDEDVAAALDSLRQSAGHYVPIEPRPAADGDFVIVDVSGHYPDGDGSDFKRESVMMAAGHEDNLSEFNEALRGMVIGEERTLTMRYPQDHENKQLAGKQVEYGLRLREIKRREIPELDDDFARELGVEGGLPALRARLKEDLTAARLQKVNREARESAMRELIASHEFEVPEVMVEEQLALQMEDLARAMASRGVDLSKVEVNWKEVREKERPTARDRVRGMLLLEEIARIEGLEASEEEYAGLIERQARELGVPAEALRARVEKEHTGQALRSQLLRQKALDILVNESRITS